MALNLKSSPSLPDLHYSPETQKHCFPLVPKLPPPQTLPPQQKIQMPKRMLLYLRTREGACFGRPVAQNYKGVVVVGLYQRWVVETNHLQLLSTTSYTLVKLTISIALLNLGCEFTLTGLVKLVFLTMNYTYIIFVRFTV